MWRHGCTASETFKAFHDEFIASLQLTRTARKKTKDAGESCINGLIGVMRPSEINQGRNELELAGDLVTR